MDENRIVAHPVRPLRLVSVVFFGILAIALAVLISRLELKFQVTAIVAVVGTVGLLALRGPARIRYVMVAALAFGLSVGIDKSFFHHYFVAGSYVRWVQGAAAITVTLSLLGALGYSAVSLGETWFFGRHRHFLIERSLVVAAASFMAVGILSLANAHDVWLVLLEEIRLSTLLFISIVVMNFSRRELRFFFRCIAISVLLQAGLAAIQYTTGKTLGLAVAGEEKLVAERVAYATVFRVTGTVGHSNILAYFFEITVPLMLALAFVVKSRFDRGLFFTAMVSGVGGMVLTMSRGAWMSLPLTVAFILYMVPGRRLLTLKASVIGILLLILLAAASVFFMPIIAERLLGDDAGSSSHRIPLDLSALSVIARFPIVGVGLNNFAVSFHYYDTIGNSRVFFDIDHVVHNLFLLVLGDVGVLGLLAFSWYFVSAFRVAGKIVHNGDPWSRAAALGLVTGLCAHLLHGMVDPGFKLSLTISQLIAASIGAVGCLALHPRDASDDGRKRLQYGFRLGLRPRITR